MHPLMDLESQPISNPIPILFWGPIAYFELRQQLPFPSHTSHAQHTRSPLHGPTKSSPTCIVLANLFFFFLPLAWSYDSSPAFLPRLVSHHAIISYLTSLFGPLTRHGQPVFCHQINYLHISSWHCSKLRIAPVSIIASVPCPSSTTQFALPRHN